MNNQNVKDAEVAQSEPISIVENLRERAFDSSNEKLSLALGRPTSEIEAWFEGNESIDDDVLIKARGIAQERKINLD